MILYVTLKVNKHESFTFGDEISTQLSYFYSTLLFCQKASAFLSSWSGLIQIEALTPTLLVGLVFGLSSAIVRVFVAGVPLVVQLVDNPSSTVTLISTIALISTCKIHENTKTD